MPELVTLKELRDLGVVYTRQHIARLEAAGKFPKRVRLGEARIAWVEKEVKDWVRAKIKAREQT